MENSPDGNIAIPIEEIPYYPNEITKSVYNKLGAFNEKNE